MAASNRRRSALALICILLIAPAFTIFGEAAKRRVHITDDLDDVLDDEEDEYWKEWGKKKPAQPEFDPPPEDFSNMDPAKMQAEMMKRQTGPVFGFAKLRLGTRRTTEIVSEMAMKWTNLAVTGGIKANFMGVDISTIMFTMEKGQDAVELQEFIFSQPDAYEIKMGDQIHRRPGDPPFDQVFEEYQNEKTKSRGGHKGNKHTEL